MKFCIIGDLHLRLKAPEKRKETNFFFEVCEYKLQQIYDIAKEEKVSALLQVGDFFDSPNPSFDLLAKIIFFLNDPDNQIPLFVIHGQHDLAYHTQASRKKSALFVLHKAFAASVLDISSEVFPFPFDEPQVYLGGAAWGQEVPKPKEGNFNILLAHVMVGDRPLFPGQEITAPEAYVRKNPGYNLYCLGDYHYPFTQVVENCGNFIEKSLVVNPGCVIRQKASQRELWHKPQVLIYDTTKPLQIKERELKIKSVEEAFNLEDVGNDTEEKEKRVYEFEKMIENLRITGKIGINFRQNLQDFFEKDVTDRLIRDIIEKAFGGIEDIDE